MDLPLDCSIIETLGARRRPHAGDSWSTASDVAEVVPAATTAGTFGLTPDSKDAVLLVTLVPGSYTAQVSGLNNTTGTGLVEVYEAPQERSYTSVVNHILPEFR